MQAQRSCQLLLNLQTTTVAEYLTPPHIRSVLKYPKNCLTPILPQNLPPALSCANGFHALCVGLGCSHILTTQGQQLIKIAIADMQGLLYEKQFNVKGQVLDLFTHVTGIDEDIWANRAMEGAIGIYGHQDLEVVMGLLQGKVVVGFDLGEDLGLLGVQHSMFVDLVWLMPHHFGLPYKNKLKNLAMQYLNQHIHWESQNPVQTCQSSLKIGYKHISQGLGTIQRLPYGGLATPQPYLYNPTLLLHDIRMDPSKCVLLYLRGSRALNIAIQDIDGKYAYQSDWDYVLVYDVQGKLDGRLIKLPGVDVSFFDLTSYHKHLENNDISYIQGFFVKPEFIYFNRGIEFPDIEVGKLRASLGFHVNKSKMKAKRFRRELAQHPQYAWKILKAHHLVIRFFDLFQQLFEYQKQLSQKAKSLSSFPLHSSSSSSSSSSIGSQLPHPQLSSYKQELLQKIDISRTNPLWYQIEKEYRLHRNLEEALAGLQAVEIAMFAKVNDMYWVPKGRGRGDGDMGNGGDVQKQESSVLSMKMENEDISPLAIVNYLRTTPTALSTLQQTHRISHRRHKRYPNILQLRYKQSANFSNKMVTQCRGLILDEAKNYQVVAYPYSKFYDFNDSKYSQLSIFDWASAKFYQKKDGSLAFLYYYNGAWEIASASVPDGQNQYCFGSKYTTREFREQFFTVFYAAGCKLPSEQDRGKTFVFQLMSKDHIIVVRRTKSQIILHGVRDMTSLLQQDPTPYKSKYNWPTIEPLFIPQAHKNMESLIALCEGLDPHISQGFILMDKNYTRIKLKNSNYVRINWLGELNLTPNQDPKKYLVVEIILQGQADIFCQYCPEWAHIIKEYVTKIRMLNQETQALYEKIKDLERKEYVKAIEGLQREMQSLLFAVRDQPHRYLGCVEQVFNPKKFYTFISGYKPKKNIHQFQ